MMADENEGFPAPILALDQGTSSSRALIYASTPRPQIAQQALASLIPKGRNGWVEQDPEAIWQTSMEAAREVLKAHQGSVAALGITNQRETTILWDRKTGQPIYNAIVWQDRRTEPLCQTLRDEGLGAMIAARTGLLIDPYFSATKIKWILDEVEGAKEKAARGELAFGTVESFLIYRLTKGQVHACDATNASRTMLFDIHKSAWDDDLLNLFNIPRAILPEVRDSADDFGQAHDLVRGGALPITSAVGDQQAAAIGQNCLKPGQAKSTYGTGCFLLVHTGARAPQPQKGLLATTAYRINGESAYALEGSIFMAGAIVQWLRDRLGLITDARQSETLAARAAQAEGDVYFVPALIGLGAPYWDAAARGAFFGLAQTSGAAEMVRACLESVGYQTRDLLDAMTDVMTQEMADQESKLAVLRVDGGMAANDWLMQFIADITGMAVERPADIETTARGAALLAALGAGLYDSLDAAAGSWHKDAQFTPNMDQNQRAKKLKGWDEAVKKVLTGNRA